jgi:hypothetical protein
VNRSFAFHREANDLEPCTHVSAPGRRAAAQALLKSSPPFTNGGLAMLWTWWYILLLLFPSAILVILMKDAMKTLQGVARLKTGKVPGRSRIHAEGSRRR